MGVIGRVSHNRSVSMRIKSGEISSYQIKKTCCFYAEARKIPHDPHVKCRKTRHQLLNGGICTVYTLSHSAGHYLMRGDITKAVWVLGRSTGSVNT